MNNQKKIFVIAVFTVFIFSLAVFKSDSAIGAVTILDDDTATIYKTKCQMCHTAKALKNFDETKADEVLADVVLKGKDAKPIKMPEFESKGMTQEQAKVLVSFMKDLKKQSASEANPK